jgi:steroid 5-alpha reductase family enzyme
MSKPGFLMTALYLEALVAIAASLSVLMAGAWVVRRAGNSGWVDTIWTFSLGLVGAGSALWPFEGALRTAFASANSGRVCDVGLWPPPKGMVT